MARTSITGYSRQYGSDKGATPAVFFSLIQFTLDINQVNTTLTGVFLPKGAIPVGAENFSANGSAASTIDVGLAGGSVQALANEMLGQVNTNRVVTGDSLGVELLVNTEVTAGHGITQGTGNVLVGVFYIMADDGKA